MVRKKGYVPRRPRHQSAGTAGVRVEVERGPPSAPEPIEVELVDLSRKGMRVRAAVSLSVGETITVRLHDETTGLGLERRATVRWSDPRQQGTWWIGCEFFERVDWETLGELFLNDVLSTDPPRSRAVVSPPASADPPVTEACGEAPSTSSDA
jgi:hypothetical protein